jgi:acetyl esterase/lipase
MNTGHHAPIIADSPTARPAFPPLRRRGLLRGAAALFGAAATGACGVAPIVPSEGGGGAGLETDVAYGPLEQHRMTIYTQAGSGGDRPVIVAFHGGFWQQGHRDEGQMHLMASRLAARGAVVALADYRKYPQVRFPGFVEDGALALAWMARNAHRLGGNPRRLIAMGHSAGAHIAVLNALDPRYLAPHGVRLAGAVGIAGPYGTWFQRHPLVSGVFPEGTEEASSPLLQARGGRPPLLLIGAGLDVICRASDNTELAEAVRAAGGEAESQIYALANHISLMLPPMPEALFTVADIARFMGRVRVGVA